MTINSVSQSNTPGIATPKTAAQKVQSDFKSLGNALQAGDLAGAKAAFATLQKDLPKNATPVGSDNSSKAPLGALATALKTGDLSAAKQAFAKLQTTQEPVTRPAAAKVAPSSAQAQAASAKQEAQKTVAQTKTEAAKGDGQAVRKLAQIAAKVETPTPAPIVTPDGTGRILRALS